MIKFFSFFTILIFCFSCSLDDKSGIWSKTQKVEKEKKISKKNLKKELFADEKAIKKEFNINLRIKLKAKPVRPTFTNKLDNNIGRIDYNGDLKKISKFKFSKIKNFYQAESDLVFDEDNIIFFEKKGTILKFNSSSKLIWKKNYYTKREKKLHPFLFFANNRKTLIVADNIAKYYALNIKTGDLLWSKSNSSSFNSQIKIYKDKFFVIDFENILRCYSLKNGNEIWNIKTDKSFIKSQKKLSLIIMSDKIYFSNSLGDISAVDIDTGNLVWQTPTQITSVYEDNFFLKTSDLIGHESSILFSNNNNEFFSLDAASGVLNWKQRVNSNVRPIIIDNLIFTVSVEGFLTIINNRNGNILRTTDLFEKFTVKLLLEKEKTRAKFKPKGFVVGTENIYLTTDEGRLFIIDILTGKTKDIMRIDRESISRPFVLDQNLFIIKDNAIVKLN